MSALNDKIDYIIFELTKITNDLDNLNKELDKQDKIVKAREVADLQFYNKNRLLNNGENYE
jgi:hypothetical protein